MSLPAVNIERDVNVEKEEGEGVLLVGLYVFGARKRKDVEDRGKYGMVGMILGGKAGKGCCMFQSGNRNRCGTVFAMLCRLFPGG